MLFKTFTLLTAATAAMAAPVACEQPQAAPSAAASASAHKEDNTHPTYTLNLFPGAGVAGMKPLQIRGTTIVYGLDQGYSYFKIQDVGSALANVIGEGQDPKQLYVADDGELVVSEHPATTGKGHSGGWGFKGDGSVKEFSSYGTTEFYSCTSKDDPLHGGPVVYVKTGKYACDDPVKFTIGATKE